METQWGGPTCSTQVRTILEETASLSRVVERQGHESEVPFEEVARGGMSRI